MMTKQVSFKNRQTQDDVRQVLHLIEHLRKTKDKSIVLSLHTKKVFVSVGWEYLYLTLQIFVFNSSVIQFLNNVYHSPTARLKKLANFSTEFILTYLQL